MQDKRRQRALWRAFKDTLSCVVCGVSESDLLDFHHLPAYRDGRDPDKMSVNVLVGDGRFTRARQEVAKCVVLCANCHRLGHAFERRGLPKEPSSRDMDLARYFILPVLEGDCCDDDDSGEV